MASSNVTLTVPSCSFFVARKQKNTVLRIDRSVTPPLMATIMRGAGVLALLCLSIFLLAEAQQSALRVTLKKRTLDAEQVRATQTALHARNVRNVANALRGEPEEADIPLLDFLDAQCMHPCHRQLDGHMDIFGVYVL